MAFGGLTDSEITAIELAVSVSGAQAVTDLQNKFHNTVTSINGYKAALAAGTITTGDFIANTKDLIETEERLKSAIDAANNALNGISNNFNATGRNAQGATRAVLEFSRGFEDFSTGGFLGVLNNIPGLFGGIAQAAGVAAPQVAAIEASASLLATTGYLVYTHWKDVKALFDDGLGVKLIDDIKAVQQELKDLTEKEYKTRIDVQDITIAKEKLDELNEAKRGFEGLNARSEAEKKRGQGVTDAVVEGGGRDAVTRAVLAATVGEETPEVKAAREKMEAYNARISALQSAGLDVPTALQQEIDVFKRTAGGKAAIADQNRRTAVEQQLGKAAMGDEIQRKWLEELFNANQGKFQAAGVDTDRFGAGLANAAPDRLFAEDRQKMARKRREDEERLANEDAQDETRDRAQRAADARRIRAENERRANQDAQADTNDRTKRERDADAIRSRLARENDAAARAGVRAAPGLQQRQAEAGYGQEFQSRARKAGFGVNGTEAESAGKAIAQAVGNGSDVNAAMEAALVKWAAGLDAIRRNQAGQLAAWQRLQAMANGMAIDQGQAAQVQQRQATATPTRNKTFRGRR